MFSFDHVETGKSSVAVGIWIAAPPNGKMVAALTGAFVLR
jgi:hypothetical protein